MRQVRWGVLGTAKIARERLIPAMQRSPVCDVLAIASRDIDRARATAAALNLPRPYGSYDALLDDDRVDAVYIALPNHMHVPWSIRALEAGKHVLCEKPLGLNAAEATHLLDVSHAHPRLKIMEASMYRFHPQWEQVVSLVRDGRVGTLRSVQTTFAYHNTDPRNVRNQRGIGGGGLLDIGCYCISVARLVFDAEPTRVLGIAEFDTVFATDTLTSGILDFGRGHAMFSCSTQLTPFQRVTILGTGGRLELESPFTPPTNAPHRIWQQWGSHTTELLVGPHDQYQRQVDLFSRAILDDTPVPTPLSDAVATMRVIDAVFLSAEVGSWI